MVKPLMFMRWCEYYELSDRETDFISFFMMNFSAARSGNQPKLREQFIDIQKKTFPEYPFDITPEELDYPKFEGLMRQVLKIHFDTAELLYSFYLQKLCAPLAEYILSTGESEPARIYYKLIQKDKVR
ncbi:hypothetical protein ASL14_14980 [Paenibacillus sp. IHB B 3084]|uniref:hypothetical protein n=1 Tax=Paenibacillus TaxID=44249 RepID=UPI00071F6385|nr:MULTISPECIES: hypothetical protein [Paenibacillus]ALP37302.1 hypothetical protein ASL14_14980 [Paenibacillus sp. IHB B 3084]